MAKANGCCSTSSEGSGSEGRGGSDRNVSIHSKYTRNTELRRVEDNDIYKLAILLDVNACWRKLMSIIPKGLDAQARSAAGTLDYKEVAANGGFKYTAQHISLIDAVAERLPADKSISQVMIDEWKCSGQLNERPTVGVLLQLLVQAELFSAADFVALDFLNEPKPERPAAGPAAHFSLDFSADELCEEMEIDNDAGTTHQPSTTALNAQVGGGSVGMNLDYFDKHMVPRDKSVPQHVPNGSANEAAAPAPVAPPRAARSLRQQKAFASSTLPTTASVATPTPSTPNVPILSILNASSSELVGNEEAQSQQDSAPNEQQETPQNIPHLSILNATANVSMTTVSTALDEDSNGASTSTSTNSEHQHSNNDSSLTTVTGTSGENSFELTNDSSSASNDDSTNNIPNLSELQLQH